jgi:hypothetical protein
VVESSVFLSAVRKETIAPEAQREPRVVSGHARRVARARGDLVGQHLHHDRRLQPGVGDEDRVHPGRFHSDLEAGQPLVQLAPALVGQAGAELADGPELVLVAVVDAGEQGAGAELGPLALAAVVAEQDDVDGVVQLAAGAS